MNKRQVLDELERRGLLRPANSKRQPVKADDLPSRAAAAVRPMSELQYVLQRGRW